MRFAAVTSMLALGMIAMAGCHNDRTVVVKHRPVAIEPPPEGVIIVHEAPPPVIVERYPPSPGPEYLLIGGYWHWTSQRYVWQPGHWAIPPRSHEVWLPPRYENHGRDYHYTPGRWQGDRSDDRGGDRAGDRGDQRGTNRQDDRRDGQDRQRRQ